MPSGCYIRIKPVWNKNKHNIYSEKTILKMSLAKKGKSNLKLSKTRKRLFVEGRLIPPFKGKHIPESVRIKMSLAKKGKKNPKLSEIRKRMFREGKLKSWNEGKHLSEDIKRHISEAKKGKMPWIKGKHHTEETKKKIGEKAKLRPSLMLGRENKWGHHSEESKRKIGKANSGENNHFWKGGLSFEPYTLEFNNWLKEQIRTRDNFTCQLCRLVQNGQKHCVHHIDYNKKNCDPNNLITLCRRCHTQTNISNRYNWLNYFNGDK